MEGKKSQEWLNWKCAFSIISRFNHYQAISLFACAQTLQWGCLFPLLPCRRLVWFSCCQGTADSVGPTLFTVVLGSYRYHLMAVREMCECVQHLSFLLGSTWNKSKFMTHVVSKNDSNFFLSHLGIKMLCISFCLLLLSLVYHTAMHRSCSKSVSHSRMSACMSQQPEIPATRVAFILLVEPTQRRSVHFPL